MASLSKRSLLVLVLVLLVGIIGVSAVVLDNTLGHDTDDGGDTISDGDTDDSGNTTLNGNIYDVGNYPEITAIEPLPGGGYLVGGNVGTRSSRDIVLLRIDANLSLESVHRFGGNGSDHLSDLTRTGGGGFAFVGWRGEFDTSVGWIVNVDANGDIVYDREIGSPSQYADRVNAVLANDNGTIAAVGRTSRGVSNGTGAALYKLDSDGDVLLERVYQAGANRSAKDIVQAEDGEYLIVGADGHQPIPYNNNKTSEAWFARVAATGDPLWTTVTSRGERRGGVATEIVDAHGDGYVAVVVTARRGIGGGLGMALHRLTPEGEVFPVQDVEYTCSSDGGPFARGADGYVLVRVTCTDDSPENDAIIERLTEQGTIEWRRTFSEAEEQQLTAVTVQKDGTYVAAGTKNEQIWVQTVTATRQPAENNATTNGNS